MGRKALELDVMIGYIEANSTPSEWPENPNDLIEVKKFYKKLRNRLSSKEYYTKRKEPEVPQNIVDLKALRIGRAVLAAQQRSMHSSNIEDEQILELIKAKYQPEADKLNITLLEYLGSTILR